MRAKSKSLLFALLLSSPLSAIADNQELASLRALFAPLPETAHSASNPPNDAKIKLGKRLYLDPRFSLSESISCNSCHKLDNYGVDNEPTSPGHNGQRGGRNSPTVYNAALHVAQFWDGRAADVEAQALGPVLNPIEMALPSEEAVVKKINSDATYPSEFKAAFPEDKQPVSFKNFGRAIGAFERTLITPSRFDDFIKGDDKALTKDEINGLKTFRDVGCVSCHNGALVGGMMYQKLGLVKPYMTKDLGRYEITKNEADKFFFKVPSLRNVEKTWPYLHDGSIASLSEAIKLMGEYQLGRTLSDDQVHSITLFLKTLTAPAPKA